MLAVGPLPSETQEQDSPPLPAPSQREGPFITLLSGWPLGPFCLLLSLLLMLLFSSSFC